MQLKHFAAPLILALTLGACTSAPLRDTNVPIPQAQLSDAQIGEIVKNTLVARHWILSNARGNSVDAEYRRPGLSAKINVSWDPRAIYIRYVDSEGLDFEQHNGQRVIHSTYNRWIGNLEHDLPIYIGRAETR